MFARFLFFYVFLSILFRTAWWLHAGKELSSWLSALAIFSLCRVNCMCSFPIWCLAQGVEYDCIGSHLIQVRLSQKFNPVHQSQNPQKCVVKMFLKILVQIKSKMCSFKSIENIHKKENDGSYYIGSANSTYLRCEILNK